MQIMMAPILQAALCAFESLPEARKKAGLKHLFQEGPMQCCQADFQWLSLFSAKPQPMLSCLNGKNKDVLLSGCPHCFGIVRFGLQK